MPNKSSVHCLCFLGCSQCVNALLFIDHTMCSVCSVQLQLSLSFIKLYRSVAGHLSLVVRINCHICWWPCGTVPDLHLQGCGFESRPRLLCTNANSACHPYRVWQWVPASTGEWTGILRLMKCRSALPCGPKKLHKYTFSLQTIQQTCRLLVGMWAMLPVSLHCQSHYNLSILLLGQ